MFEEIDFTRMPKKYLLLISICIAICIFIAGYHTAAHFARVRELETAQALKPTAESVLIALKGQGFLITQTYLFNQSVTIDHASGSFFKDLFWNQIVSATANLKVSSGVDLSKLSLADIEQNGTKITISLPLPTRYSTEVLGAVSLQNKQGVLKKLFDSDNGYNQALAALKNEAEKAAETSELLQDAQQGTEKEISRLVQLFVPGAEVHLVFK